LYIRDRKHLIASDEQREDNFPETSHHRYIRIVYFICPFYIPFNDSINNKLKFYAHKLKMSIKVFTIDHPQADLVTGSL